MSNRSIDLFAGVMKKADKISDGCYKATTAKRITLLVPPGLKIFDTDLNIVFVGDGVTNGGVVENAVKRIRRFESNAAATGATASETTDKFTWAGASGLRTGDGIVITGGTGTVPSGITASGTYWVAKDTDIGDGSDNSGTTFKVATSRANAVAGTVVDLLGSGVPGWTIAVSTIVAKKTDDIVSIDPATSAMSVVLPYPNTARGFSIVVRKDSGAGVVSVGHLDASGGVATSGAVTIDNTVGFANLPASLPRYGQFVADADNGEYFTLVGGVGASGMSVGNS